MGLSAILNIGKNAINTYRIAQEVTSENIANVNTLGYSRQRVILEAGHTNSTNGFMIGSGVNVAKIERYYDGMLQQQLVNAHTPQGYYTTKSNVLQQVEQTFNEITNEGLGASISDYFAAWQDLSLNPAGSAERQVVLSRAEIMTDNFHSVSTTLNNASTSLNDSLTPLTDSINNALKNIADLNGQIKSTEQMGGNSNETRDQRDQLIRDISSQIGITYTENSDGTTDIKYKDSGAVLVTGSTAGAFSLTTNAVTGFYDVNLTPPGGAAVIVTPTTGQLGAVISLRDTIIPGYINKIDELAYNIATAVNLQHNGGLDINGNIGADFFTAPVTTAGYASLITTNITSIDEIAASDALGGLGNNANAAAIANISSQAFAFSTGTTTIGGHYANVVSQIGLDVETSNNTVIKDIAFTNQLTTLRESNSGVSLDEELTNLVKYQRSYQASAKLITTATDMMDIVLSLVR